VTYLTPDRFRTMGYGVDFTAWEDVEIRSSLFRASATVDAYCAVSLQPQRHDFRGGTITNEMHEWIADQYERNVHPLRFYPWHRPIKTVTQLRIYSTPTVYTEILPTEVFINNSAGFIEVSSLKLTQYGIFGSGVITALVGLWNPQVVMSYTYGYNFPVVGEILEDTDAFLYRAQNQWWDSGSTTTVYKNGVEQTTGFAIDYNEGTVTFDDALAASDVVTVDYSYKLPVEIAQATGYIAAEDFGESALVAKGMSGIDTLTVGEITLRRSTSPGQRGANSVVQDFIPEEAQVLLDGFVQTTVR